MITIEQRIRNISFSIEAYKGSNEYKRAAECLLSEIMFRKVKIMRDYCGMKESDFYKPHPITGHLNLIKNPNLFKLKM